MIHMIFMFFFLFINNTEVRNIWPLFIDANISGNIRLNTVVYGNKVRKYKDLCLHETK